MEFLSVVMGIGLSAACGFRIFVPFFIMSVAVMNGYIKPAAGFEWIGTYPALICFSVATIVEILAYLVPVVDNFLDAIASPCAVVAGIILASSCITGLDPYMKWTLAIIAGGAAAGVTQTATSATRLASTAGTGGFLNSIVSIFEAVISTLLSVAAIFFPLVCLGIVVVFVIYAFSLIKKKKSSGTFEGKNSGAGDSLQQQ